MSLRVHTEIFDYALYPYSLGDTLTWCVRSAIRAKERGCAKVEVLICSEGTIPHCVLQPGPNERQFELALDEVLPAFRTHPLLHTISVFNDREEFNQALVEKARLGTLPMGDLEKYRAVCARRQDPFPVIDYFHEIVSDHQAINDFYARTGAVPRLREPAGCQADVENLIKAQGEDILIVAVQFRLRQLDRAIVAKDFMRDAAYFAWERFFVDALEKFPQVRFCLLGRLQEKPLGLLQLPNVIAPRLLGLGLGHELSLVMRAHLFLGTSSGFAECAYFSHTPYRIFNLSQSATETYARIPHGAEQLPFALPNQRLVYGLENAALLEETTGEALAEIAKTKKEMPRTHRPNLMTMRSEDATTFRFMPDLRQVQQENSQLILTSLSRIQQNFTEGKTVEALAELHQVKCALEESTRKFSLTSSAQAHHPRLREWLRYWRARLLGRSYSPSHRPKPETWREFPSESSFRPRAWGCNGIREIPRKDRLKIVRLKAEQPGDCLRCEAFRLRKPGMLQVIFQARRTASEPAHSALYLWENGHRHLMGAPLYTRKWNTYYYEFLAKEGAELQLHFDHHVVGKWLLLRKVTLNNAIRYAEKAGT